MRGCAAHRLLGTAGQNIDDLFKYVEGGDDKDRLAMACRTLDWGHVAPTAPDTLCESWALLSSACFGATLIPAYMHAHRVLPVH